MSMSNAAETAILNHLFNNSAIANVGDATGLPAAATAGSLYVSLHTADPGEAGTQSTSEATYTGYARQAVARTSGGWTVSGATASNAAAINFGPATAGSETITHVGIGVASSGTGTLLFKAALSSSLAVSSTSNQTQTLAIGALTITLD